VEDNASSCPKGFRGKTPTSPQPRIKARITGWETSTGREAYRRLQAVKILYRAAFTVWLKPLVRAEGDPPHFHRIIQLW